MSQIKALILAGGFGTRLRPLSCSRPKLLFSIAGKTMIEWILDGLSRNGIDEAILATNYLANMIRNHLGGKYDGIKLHYSVEDEPLGTGGPIKKAERFLREGGDFLVLNGDILSSPNLKEMLKKHASTKAIATIMLHKVKDPTHFGVAELDKSLRIVKFVEKPRMKDAPSRWINAGFYILNSQILDYIPSGRKVSIEREVFPVLASSGRLYGYRYNEEWFDIGRFEEYRRANASFLSRLSKTKPTLSPGVEVEAGTKLVPPIIIGPKSVVRKNVVLGPNISVGEAVVIGEGSKISNTILFDRVHLGNNTSIRGAIIGEAALIGNNVEIGEGCVVGDHVLIQANLTLKRNVSVCPNKEVSRSIKHPRIVS